MFTKTKIEDDRYYYCKVKQTFPLDNRTINENSTILAHSRIARIWAGTDAVDVDKALKAVDASAEVAKLDGIRSLSVRVRAVQTFVDADFRLYTASQTVEVMKDRAAKAMSAGLLVVVAPGQVYPVAEPSEQEIAVARKSAYWQERESVYPTPDPIPEVDWDSVGDWVKVLLLQGYTDGSRGRFAKGAVADFPVAVAQAMVQKRVGEVVGAGSEPVAELSPQQATDKRFADLQSELEKLRQDQQATQRAAEVFDRVVFHPTSENDKTQIKRRG